MVICLERGAVLHTAQLMPLPLTVSCFSKIQIDFTFLVPAHPGSYYSSLIWEQSVVMNVSVCMSVSLHAYLSTVHSSEALSLSLPNFCACKIWPLLTRWLFGWQRGSYLKHRGVCSGWLTRGSTGPGWSIMSTVALLVGRFFSYAFNKYSS